MTGLAGHRAGSMRRALAAGLLAAVLGQPSAVAARDWRLTDGAKAHPEYRGSVPRRSDVVLSTRFKRDNAVDAMKAFGATRVEWVYSADEEFVASLKEAAEWFGGAINSNASNSRIRPPGDEAMAKDFDGTSLVHSWMMPWGRGGPISRHPGRYVTTAHPDARRVLLDQARTYIAVGANSIQFDDPLLQVNAVHGWRGDFNPSSLAGFSRYLAAHPNQALLKKLGLDDMRGDYREFLRSKYGVKDTDDYRKRYRSLPGHAIWLEYHRHEVRDFFEELSRLLRGATPPMALSMNLTLVDWPDERNWHFFLTPFIDYAMPETHVVSTADMAVRAATWRAMGIGYVPSLKLRGRAQNRVAIATLYALGGQPIVPWDVNVGNDESGRPRRIFGTVEEYGDLYHFVRSHPALFDGKELAAVVGIPVPVHRFDRKATAALVRRLQEHQVPFAFLLAGGRESRFAIDAGRARHVKALVLANPESDFSAGDLAALQSLSVPRMQAAELTDEAIGGLAPFVVPGGSKSIRLYPRASATGGRLEIHVVDEARGGQEGGAADCERRIGIRKSAIGGRGPARATWYSTQGTQDVRPQSGDGGTFFAIRDCGLWGVLSLSLQPGPAAAAR